MRVLIFGLCTLALTLAAPSHGPKDQGFNHLSDAMLDSEEFWTGSHPYLAALAAQKDSSSGSISYNGIWIDNSVQQACQDLYAKATVNGYVSNGKLALGVNSTVASVGGNYSTLAIAVENATLLTGGFVSGLAIVAKSSNIYSMSVNNSVDVVAKNSQYTDLMINSSSKIFVSGSNLNLMVLDSSVRVYAFNSVIKISNATSTIKIFTIKNSTVTYVPPPPPNSNSPAAVKDNNFDHFNFTALHSSNSGKAKAIQEAWQKLEKMAEESAKIKTQ